MNRARSSARKNRPINNYYRLTFFFFWGARIRSVLSESLSDSRSSRLMVSFGFGFSILVRSVHRMSRVPGTVGRPWPIAV